MNSRNQHTRNTPPKQMFSKPDFVKLRTWTTWYLKHNGEINGYSCLPHDLSNQNFGSDLRPFAGMAPVFKGSACTIFWDALLKQKLVVQVKDISGRVYYHLPSIPPWTAETWGKIMKRAEMDAKFAAAEAELRENSSED